MMTSIEVIDSTIKVLQDARELMIQMRDVNAALDQIEAPIFVQGRLDRLTPAGRIRVMFKHKE